MINFAVEIFQFDFLKVENPRDKLQLNVRICMYIIYLSITHTHTHTHIYSRVRVNKIILHTISYTFTSIFTRCPTLRLLARLS